MSVIFLFVDGIGLGEKDETNPFYKNRLEGFKRIAGGESLTAGAARIEEKNHLFKPIDATLGVDGLPQSGTGQTSLFTGRNAAKEIGRHFGPFPHSGIKKFLKEESIFHKAQERGTRCRFMNAYPDIFFKKAIQRNRWSCTTLMSKSAGISLHGEKEVKEGKAITAEITQQAWKNQLNIDVPEIGPEEAARRFIRGVVKNSLLLHEYYLTDKAGHAKDHEKAASYLEIYDRFLDTLIREKKEEDTIVLSSDHGNLEDLSVKTHTLNPVPLFVCGPGSRFFRDAESIMDVTPAILEVIEIETGE